MRTLEMSEMEMIEGGQCGGQAASFAGSSISIVYATLAAGPIGFGFSVVMFGISLYNLNNCMDGE